MLNVLTKYSTMVTDGSTGSTSYVPMMPRAKGFCITTHKKRTQKAGKQLCLLVYLRGNKKAAAFNCAPPCALRAVINAKREMAAQREKSALLPSALFFWWSFRPAVPHRPPKNLLYWHGNSHEDDRISAPLSLPLSLPASLFRFLCLPPLLSPYTFAVLDSWAARPTYCPPNTAHRSHSQS